MRIRELALQPFRNFDRLQVCFAHDHSLIVGGNGCGKSNLLEAVSYLSIGRSVRGVQDQQAVPHHGRYFDVQAQCHDGQRLRQLRVFYDDDGKRVFCDGANLPRVADILGIFKTVHFSPEDVSLVLRFPNQRRRLLDILISQSSAPYLYDLQRYQRVLRQRNRVLRGSAGGTRTAQDEVLQAWNGQLARLGARLRRQRLEAVGAMQPLVASYYQRFSGRREEARVTYRAGRTARGEACPSEEELHEDLLEEMARNREREWQQGCSLCGPHRDQVLFALGDQPADAYASEGQLKCLLISWKMAEARFLEQQAAQQPVLLLDDAFSELDESRSEELRAAADEFEQVILTAPRAPDARFEQGYEQIRLAG